MTLPARKRWQVLPPAPAEHLQHFGDLPPLVVQLLYNRGLSEASEVAAFLAAPGEEPLGDPLDMRDMRQAVQRIQQAIASGERIVVYGDFDVDGITSAALLVQTLEALGARASPYIPRRLEEGYGLNLGALDRLAAEDVRLVITVDNGISALAEVEHAHTLGIDVIVTDHHHVPPQLPRAVAILNPKRPDCPYPFKELAGVGVAFKLAQALSELRIANCEFRNPKSEMDLVALGTVVDMAPLIGENRALARRGLAMLNQTQRPGLLAMIARAGLRLGQIDSSALSFALGPRLNAAGRIDDAIASYRLLVTDSADEAATLADDLEAKNQERQRLTAEVLERARSQACELGDVRLLLVAGEGYAAGVVGLVAGRLVDEFYRPALVVEWGEERSRGSARSIPEFNIVAALTECQDLLVRFGGHAMAAGFTIETPRLAALQGRLLAIADRELRGLDLTPTLFVDAELPLAQASWATYNWVGRLAPFGYANPTPTFLSRRVHVREARVVGNNHLRLKLADGPVVWDAIGFRLGDWAEPVAKHPSIDVVYTLETSQWGAEEPILQLNVKDLRLHKRQV
ncbi:MAG: single-stranded-DNA-specific exonuclease RecJ [Chloroflexi bacterium]|nr:single-stranded-DNA-specific exonuclease RecJ [Chloroflexota bacterium]